MIPQGLKYLSLFEFIIIIAFIIFILYYLGYIMIPQD